MQSVESYLESKENGVSVVVLSKDNLPCIERCIQGILDNFSGRFEIILGDTGTTDKNTIRFYEEISEFENIDIFWFNQFHFSKNNNYLASFAQYNKLLFLNNDVFVDSDITTEMSSLLKLSTGIVGLKLLFEDSTIQHVGVQMIHQSEDFYLPEHIEYKKPNHNRDDEFVDCVTGACMMIPTTLFLEAGKFEEAYNIVFQDVDMCLKLRNLGWDVVCCNKSSAIHLESATREHVNDESDYWLMVSRWSKTKSVN